MRTIPFPLHRVAVALAVFVAVLALFVSAPLSAQTTSKSGTTTAAGVLDPSRKDILDLSGKLKGMKLESGVHLVQTLSSGVKIWAMAKDGKVVNWVVIDRTGRPLLATPVADDDPCTWCTQSKKRPEHCWRWCGPAPAPDPRETKIR